MARMRVPFLGSDGRVGRARLRGPGFQAVFRGVHVEAGEEATPAERALAAALLVRGRGVLGGWSAAELLDASCAPEGAPAEVIVAGLGVRGRRGLLVRHDLLGTSEVTAVRGVPVTTCLRTARDLACRPPLVTAVVAVDALSRVGGFDPAAVLDAAPPGLRGRHLLEQVVRRADRRSGSPMETRIRPAIEDDGLPTPVLQHGVGPYALDLACPRIRLGIEHDGKDHLTAERARRDLRRQAYLTSQSWTVLRFSAGDVLYRPRRVAAEVRGSVIEAARNLGLTLAELHPLLVS